MAIYLELKLGIFINYGEKSIVSGVVFTPVSIL